ncbi:acyltransferase [Dactylosporangium roseum]|uniref:Acyltransferase n=1 Tax=Dactylosporangium roseum TaxID=47989 RepID=A0ABY5YX07_9ACTN|nr:acyltransferase [Dactylosporangium roseum]UWZ33934.1 acyltransferase [Dactylosporangium roseum]
MRKLWRFGLRGRLAGVFNGRDNGFGTVRLGLALSVVITHATSLGFGWEDLGLAAFRGQTNVGTFAVFGFFVLSGLLITRSARRVSLPRFVWHRALRILPGLWVCLLVTAFLVAPLVAWHERGSLAGFWDWPRGPVRYVLANWFVGVRQYGIQDLLAASTPWGRQTESSVFDGALWSLVYEVACYAVTGLLGVTMVLRRQRWLVPVTALVLYGLIVADQVQGRELAGPPAAHYGMVNLPLVGEVFPHWLIYLGFLFLAGATLELYRERIPVHDVLGAASAVLLVVSLLAGGFFVVGLPALVYLLVWAGVRLPRVFHGIGRRNDYSYGIYIYGFVGQQVFAGFGLNRWGYLPFTALSLVAAVAAGMLSWHLVEKRAMRHKDWTPRRFRRAVAVPVMVGPRRSTAVWSDDPTAPKAGVVAKDGPVVGRGEEPQRARR